MSLPTASLLVSTVGARVRQARTNADIPVSRVIAACQEVCPWRGDDEYLKFEAGRSSAERWAKVLAAAALETGVPASRLVSPTGQFDGIDPAMRRVAQLQHSVGTFISSAREATGMSRAQLIEAMPDANIDATILAAVEDGNSQLEVWGPRLLAISDMLQIPLFDLIMLLPPEGQEEPQNARERRSV